MQDVRRRLVHAAAVMLMSLTMCPSSVQAAPAPTKPRPKATAPATPSVTSTEKLYRETLPNGMQVVILENHRNPVVSLNVVVKVGSMYETDRINGISHFFEHLFFRGTERRTGEQFKREIESLGGQTNAKTTKDLTHFYINLPSLYAKQGLDILADALENSKLSPPEVNEERKVVIDELKIGLESPGAQIQGDIYDMAFKKHPYRYPIIGTEKNLKEISIQDCQDFKRRYYIPKRTTLILVGDVTPAEIMPTVREYFDPFTGNNNMTDDIPQEPKHAEGVREKVVRRDLQNAYVIMAFRAPSVRDRPDIYRTDMMTFLLGQGEGSLLAQQLVEEKKLALEASVDFLTQRDPGLITFEAMCAPSKVEKVKAAMLACINQVREGKFTQADFDRARALLINTYEFGNETNAGKADGLAFYAAIDNVEFAQTYLDEVRKVTFQDVVSNARKYLDLKDYNVLVVRPPDKRADKEGAELSHR